MTPWTAAHQASLSITNPQSLLKFMSIKSVIPSNHLILCHPLVLLPSIFPRIRVFSSESVIHIRWPGIGISSSTSVLPMNIQDWLPLGLTSLISLQSKGLSSLLQHHSSKASILRCSEGDTFIQPTTLSGFHRVSASKRRGHHSARGPVSTQRVTCLPFLPPQTEKNAEVNVFQTSSL